MRPSAVTQLVLRVVFLVVGNKVDPSSAKAPAMSPSEQKDTRDIPSKKIRITLLIVPVLVLIVGLVRYFVRMEDAVDSNTRTIVNAQKVIDSRLETIERDVDAKHREVCEDIDELSTELRNIAQKLAQLEAQETLYEWKISQLEQRYTESQDQIAEFEGQVDDENK